MDISQIKDQLKYITNAAGDRTEVIIPVGIWYSVLNLIPDLESGLAPIDEQEDKSSILSDLQTSIKEVSTGKSFPISELWDEIDTE